jgi:hypothetical protein
MSRRRPGSYLDTCVLVSLLHGDSGYEAAEAWLCAAADEDLWISHWVLLEFASATSVRMRRGDLSMARVNALQATLECFRHERLAMLEPRGDDFLVARRWIDTDSAPGPAPGERRPASDRCRPQPWHPGWPGGVRNGGVSSSV